MRPVHNQHMSGGGTDGARQRAEDAAARAKQLREHLEAVAAGLERLHGASVEDVADAQRRAIEARERLRRALESSAAAHDRAAESHEAVAAGYDGGSPQSTLAADHRRYAQVDRERAAELDEG
jgi:hypothetical protein